MTGPDRRAWWSRRLMAGLGSAVPLLGVAILCAASVPAVAQSEGGTISTCGRAGDVSRLLLELQKPSVERLWRDTKLFVLRDHDDGSLWAFSIKNATVHPAVRCRRRLPAGPSSGGPSPGTDSGLLCPASAAACASFAAQADERFDAAGTVGAPSR